MLSDGLRISVIIPTHNPDPHLIKQVLAALESQDQHLDSWELLVVDNGSRHPIPMNLVSWHPNARVVREPTIGLTYARIRGLAEAKSSLVAWVDDDNILCPGYLSSAVQAFDHSPSLGAAGGASVPLFNEPNPAWYRHELAPLGCRDLGKEEIWMSWDPKHPHYPSEAPIGAGLVIRKQAMQLWADAVVMDSDRLSLGRRGKALSSGEDNDINLTLLRAGWELAYLPQLRLTHVIPASRLTLSYQKRLARASFRDFVRVLDRHGMRPWPAIPRWSVPLRALRCWFRYRVWSSPAQQVRWSGALGQYEGRALIKANLNYQK